MNTAEIPRDPLHLPGVLLASGLPFFAYVATASANGHWLDSGEFVAQSASLGISHPPGHPLVGILGFIAGLVPMGNLAFRVALLAALAAAIAAGFWFAATKSMLATIGARARWIALPLGLASAWVAAGSYAWWFQGVRPEVYAVEAALTAIVIERICAFEAAAPSPDPRPLYGAMVALGFSLANHHLLGLLLLPAMAPTFARAFREHRGRLLFRSFLCTLPGIATYAYLPFRAAAEPYLNLGDPDSVARFRWVVAAEAFQKNTGDGVPQPLVERFMDVLIQLGTQMHWSVAVLAILGIWIALRQAASRRIGVFVLILLLVHIAARAWLGFVRSNPDALGYLMPAFGSLAMLAALVPGLLLRLIKQTTSDRGQPLGIVLSFGIAGSAILPSLEYAQTADLSRFTKVCVVDDALRTDLPPSSIVIAFNPQTIFRFWGGEGEDAARPDVTLVPIPFLAYPGMTEQLLADTPELRPLLEGYLVHGHLRQPELQTLALGRPILVEMDVRVPPRIFDTLVPEGLYYAVLPEGATTTDVEDAAAINEGRWADLYEGLGEVLQEPETRKQLLWRHYMDALFFASSGNRERARKSVERGLALSPHSTELVALATALSDPDETGPIDIEPFLP